MAAPPAGRAKRIALAVGDLGQRLVRARLDHLRVVELVAAHRRARRPERRACHQPRLPVAEVHLALGEARRVARAARASRAVRRRHRPALRPSTMKPPHSPCTGFVSANFLIAGAKIFRRRQFPCMQLRIAARQPADVAAFVRRFVGERRERHDLRAGLAPVPGHMRIEEAEGGVLSQRDALAGRRQRRRKVAALRLQQRHQARAPCRCRSSAPSYPPAARYARRCPSCSPACTSPRCRSGSVSVGSRITAPTTGMPSASIASPASRLCRSLPSRLSTTPAILTAGS